MNIDSLGFSRDGHLSQWQNYLKWTSRKGRVQLEAYVENDFGHIPQGNFVQRLWQLQGAYACSPNLVLSSFIQYDTESQNVGTNTRLRWTIKPGNDLFIGWNRGWQRLVLSPNDTSIVPQSDVIAVNFAGRLGGEKMPASRCSQPECDMLDGL